MSSRFHRVVSMAILSGYAAIGLAQPGNARAPEVVASIYPVELVVRELVGERITLATLVPSGGNPHTFEPVPSDLARLRGARFFFRVGGGLDDWTKRLLAAAPPTTKVVTLWEIQGLDAVGGNPHVWLDPILVRDAIVPALTLHFVGADPAGAAYYQQRSKDFSDRLTRLDHRIRSMLARTQTRKYVAFHAAWQNFSYRYRLDEIAVVQEFAGEEPTPKELARLVRAARAAGVTAILVEPQLSPRIARTVAGEFGGKTVTVDPLGDPRDPKRSSYEGLMLFNARAFVEALGGRAGER